MGAASLSLPQSPSLSRKLVLAVGLLLLAIPGSQGAEADDVAAARAVFGPGVQLGDGPATAGTSTRTRMASCG